MERTPNDPLMVTTASIDYVKRDEVHKLSELYFVALLLSPIGLKIVKKKNISNIKDKYKRERKLRSILLTFSSKKQIYFIRKMFGTQRNTLSQN